MFRTGKASLFKHAYNKRNMLSSEVHMKTAKAKGKPAFRESFAKLGELRSIAREGELMSLKMMIMFFKLMDENIL